MKIRPLYDRIVVKRVEQKEQMQGGLYIPDTAKEKPQEGEVVAVGKGKRLEDGKVVGLVSASEVFYLAAQMLGVTRKQNGITVGPLEVKSGTLTAIAALAEGHGAVVESLFSLPESGCAGQMKVILRFTGADVSTVAETIKGAGYPVIEVCPYVVLPCTPRKTQGHH